MKLRTRLTLIVTAMMVALITISSLIIFREASALQTDTTYDYAEELANSQATDIRRRIEDFTNVAKTLSLIFSDYNDLDENLRRENFEGLLSSIVTRFDEVLG
ncbi:MAG: hypothetical protein LBH42_06235, partial [Treponema sp.]|nr:hypothetical protein [Treponema sp.]